jgi:hypothetical protein
MLCNFKRNTRLATHKIQPSFFILKDVNTAVKIFVLDQIYCALKCNMCDELCGWGYLLFLVFVLLVILVILTRPQPICC